MPPEVNHTHTITQYLNLPLINNIGSHFVTNVKRPVMYTIHCKKWLVIATKKNWWEWMCSWNPSIFGKTYKAFLSSQYLKSLVERIIDMQNFSLYYQIVLVFAYSLITFIKYTRPKFLFISLFLYVKNWVNTTIFF